MTEQVRGYTIDGPSTRDIDDAIWVDREQDGWRLTVTIAGVGFAVPKGSALDDRALERVVTRYFAEGNDPMLPRVLSEGSLSLFEGEPRQTLSVEVRYDDAFIQVEIPRLFRSSFRSEARLNHSDIGRLLRQRDHALHMQMRHAAQLATGLFAARRSAGALAFCDLDRGLFTSEEGQVWTERPHLALGHFIVQETMIAANRAVAHFCLHHGIPVPFRNHPTPAGADRAELLRQLDQEVHAGVQIQMFAALPRARYGGVNAGHFALNLPAYLHFTSPIRRYPDLLVHRQVDAFLQGRPLPYTAQELVELCDHMNTVLDADRERRRDLIEHRKYAAREQAAVRAQDDVAAVVALEAKAFEHGVRTLVEAGGPCPPGIQGGFAQRLALGRVPALVRVMVLFRAPRNDPSWEQVRSDALAPLRDQPSEAPSLLSIAQSLGCAPPIAYAEAPHRDGFQVTATTLRDGGKIETVATGATKAQARHRAAALLVAALAELEVRGWPRWTPAPTPAPATKSAPAPTASSGGAGRDIAALLEHAQAHRRAQPQYTFEREGPPHQPTFRCTCVYDGERAAGSGATKQEAKAAAAHAMRRHLRHLPAQVGR